MKTLFHTTNSMNRSCKIGFRDGAVNLLRNDEYDVVAPNLRAVCKMEVATTPKELSLKGNWNKTSPGVLLIDTHDQLPADTERGPEYIFTNTGPSIALFIEPYCWEDVLKTGSNFEIKPPKVEQWQANTFDLYEDGDGFTLIFFEENWEEDAENYHYEIDGSPCWWNGL